MSRHAFLRAQVDLGGRSLPSLGWETQLFCFLGADPCTDWVGDPVARDEHGFILTGDDAGAAGLLATSAAGIYAAGDVRAGSTKRAATAVGEGAAVVGHVHQHLAEVPA